MSVSRESPPGSSGPPQDAIDGALASEEATRARMAEDEETWRARNEEMRGGSGQ